MVKMIIRSGRMNVRKRKRGRNERRGKKGLKAAIGRVQIGRN
jgi:hypothetical protein